MDIPQTVALTLGIAWASGINLYAAILMLGFLGLSGNIELPQHLQILGDPLIMAAAGIMYFMEFFADKIPGVDTVWDAIHTIIRIPAGAILAVATVADVSLPAQLAAAIAGGTLTAGTHATKTGSRALINTSPEPFSNWAASVGEDCVVIAGLWTALYHPWLFLFLLFLFVLLMIWLLPKLLHSLKKVFGFLARWLEPGKKSTIAIPLQGQDAAVTKQSPVRQAKDAD